MFSLAADLYRARDFAAARSLLEGMIANDPGDLVAHSTAGLVCSEMGDFAAAIHHFRVVTAFDVTNTTVWLKLGAAALLDQDHETAQFALNKAMDLDPKSADIHHNYASLLATLCHDHAAMHHYARAYELRPGWSEPHVGHAFCLLRQGQYKRGWAMLEKRWDKPNSGREYHGIPV